MKTVPFTAAHTYIAHKWQYPPPPTPGKQKAINLGSWAQAARGYGDIVQGGEELTKSVTFGCNSVPKIGICVIYTIIIHLKA